MALEKTNRISGGLLRDLREAQALDIARLARQVNLSVAQLRQLEADQLAPGERALFYSDTIRANAAKKVAQALGADLNELLTPPPETQASLAHEVPDMQVLDDLAQLLQKQERARQASRSHPFLQSRRLWAAAMLFMAGALLWYFQNPLLAQGHHLMAVLERPPSPTAMPAAELAREPIPVALPAVAMTADAALPAAVVAPEPAAVSLEALCASKASGAVLKPSAPNKAGKSVYIVANGDAAVCVQDASGKQFPVSLKAQESRSFYGEAPWTVHLGKASSVQLFFQGQRLRWPEGAQTSFTLQEVQGTY
ncbi:MAG: helix-turn-helix domain-containing protein [Limnohabitans sp.]